VADAAADAEEKGVSPGSVAEEDAKSAKSRTSSSASSRSDSNQTLSTDWEDHPNLNFPGDDFSQLPYRLFGINQFGLVNAELKEALKQIVRGFSAPIRYAIAYGSGVFPQTKGDGRAASDAEVRKVHPNCPGGVKNAQGSSPKMIDFVFGVSFSEHFHSLNMRQHRDHYSFLASLGSAAVTHVQEKWGAGVYYNTHVVVNGTLIKYGVVNIDTLVKDLSDWDTLYLAGRLHKPVKIIRDDARVRWANQVNLLSALRTALLLLPPNFTERELYNTIAGISYLGDPRMRFPTENPRKVANIVGNNIPNFRRLYSPLIEQLPNVSFDAAGVHDSTDWIHDTDTILSLSQDMDPVKRGNMVRRLPKTFRGKLYFQYQKKFAIPRRDFDRMMDESRDEHKEGFRRQEGGAFEQRIVQDDGEALRANLREAIRQTINWPSTTQSLKGVLTAGPTKTVAYLGEKWAKYREGQGQLKMAEEAAASAKKADGAAKAKAEAKESSSATKAPSSSGPASHKEASREESKNT
jgi:translocator assembly and maintenance protein 41